MIGLLTRFELVSKIIGRLATTETLSGKVLPHTSSVHSAFQIKMRIKEYLTSS